MCPDQNRTHHLSVMGPHSNLPGQGSLGLSDVLEMRLGAWALCAKPLAQDLPSSLLHLPLTLFLLALGRECPFPCPASERFQWPQTSVLPGLSQHFYTLETLLVIPLSPVCGPESQWSPKSSHSPQPCAVVVGGGFARFLHTLVEPGDWCPPTGPEGKG